MLRCPCSRVCRDAEDGADREENGGYEPYVPHTDPLSMESAVYDVCRSTSEVTSTGEEVVASGGDFDAHEAEVRESRDEQLRALFGRPVFRLDLELRSIRGLVGIRDARELLDLSRSRLRIEAFRIAALAFLERRSDVDLDERRLALDEHPRA